MNLIREIKIEDKDTKDILLFSQIKNVKKLNILFGGNGVGNSTFLNAIRDNKVLLESDNENGILIKSFTNSIENKRVNSHKEIITNREFVKAVNVNSFSEGQSVIHYVLSFLYDIKELETDKDIVVLLDEVDSGVSAENINMVLWQIKELIDTKNVQFFISSNHYHFVHAFKKVLNMYNGEYITIKSYDKYFSLLNDGISIMKDINKREFNFLDVY